MPYTNEQENYFKLITLIHCIGANVNRELLQKFINSRNITLEQFINDHQHEIYHFFCNVKCCQCKTKPIPLNDSGVINQSQMQIVFEYPSNDRLDNHKQERTGQLCCLKANKNVELKDLDFTLIKFFLVNFCYQIFWDCLLENVEQTFSDFLEANVHKVYHLSLDGICCCRCNVDRDIPKKRINETQFEIIYKKVRLPCQLFCSCQYDIQSGLTLSLMIQLHKDLTTKLTRYFCSCRKSLENIYNNRNKIAHPPESSINNDTFSDIWNETATNILEIAKALNKQEQYDFQLTKLRDEPTNKDSLITLLLNLRKSSDHETSNALQNISSNTDSIKTQIADLFDLFKDKQIAKDNTENSENGCTRSILDRLQDIAIAVCKESTTESNPDYLREMEVILSVEIRNARKSSKLVQEDAIGDSTHEQCNTNCTKLNEFSKQQDQEQLQTTELNSREKITYKMKVAETSENWKRKAMEMCQSNPNYFDTDLLDNEGDNSVHVKCERCGQVFRNINSIIPHNIECIRFRKKRRIEQDITMLYQRCENTLQTNSKIQAASENQKKSTNLIEISEFLGAPQFKPETTSTKVRVRVKAGVRSFSEISEQSTINRPWRLQKEEVNFAKMGMIVLNILADVLYDLLKQDKTNLRPRHDCDVTYLYSKHRKNNTHLPSNGWGGTWQRIKSTDIAVGDDIERIRLTRNELQHSMSHMLDDNRSAELYDIINELLKRFDHHNKPTRLYTDRLKEILDKTISVEEFRVVENEMMGMTIEVEFEHQNECHTTIEKETVT